jgi:hypothetical protein
MSPEDNDLADREFERRAADELKRGIEATPPEIRARLDRLVVRALQTPARSRVIRYGLPAGVVAALSAVIVALQFRAPVAPAPAAQAADDLALLLNADTLDLLEFYRWLEQQPGMLDDALAASSAPAQRS